MLTICICGIFAVAILAAAGNGELGAVLVGVVIILLAIGLHSAGRESDKAYSNVMEYWSKGGPHR